MVVVADAILESSRRPGGLNAADETFGDQNAEGVVHRLQRDRPDFAPDDVGYGVRGDVRLTRDGPQHGQSLRRNLHTALTKEIGRVAGHADRVDQFFD